MRFISSFPRHRRTSRHRSLGLAVLLFGTALTGHGLADNPWSTCSVGWAPSASDHGVPSAGWAPWGATAGGSFDTPSAPRHQSFPAAIPAIPASRAIPAAARNGDIDPVMYKAASIAEQRALPHGILRCWRYVKEALVASGGVSSYPQTVYAREAGHDLVQHYGFVKLRVRNPERAPVGAVCVYGGRGAGHVEIRTARGFASDFLCSRPAALPFLGAYTRLTSRHDTAQISAPAAPGS
jgi:hypothetical protein